MATTLGVGMQFARYGLSVNGFQILDIGGSNASMAGFQFNVGLIWVQAALLAAGTALAMLAIPRFTETGPCLQRRSLALPAVLVVSGFAPLPMLGKWDRLVPTSDDSLRCNGQTPAICVAPEHEHLIAVYFPGIERLVRAAESKGLHTLQLKTVYEAMPSTERYAQHSFPIDALDGTPPPELADLAGNLLLPRRCPNLEAGFGPRTQEDFERLLATWVAAAAPGSPAAAAAPHLDAAQADAVMKRLAA